MGHGIIAWIIIGIVAGWLTGKLMKGSGFGIFADGKSDYRTRRVT
jgi:uncharacterized membrane protein YeaQ/YmgE (transglycosylase-associated protein family)